MTLDEKKLFVSLLFSHKHLWIAFEEYRYLQEHPETDWEDAHERFSEEAEDFYQSLADALLAEKPLGELLQTVLLHSQLTVSEALTRLKDR